MSDEIQEVKCLLCDEVIPPYDPDGDLDDQQWNESLFQDGVVHENCATEDSQGGHSSTVVKYNGEWDDPWDNEKVEITPHIGFVYRDGDFEDIAYEKEGLPLWFREHFEGPVWKNTGGYRGFVDVPHHDLVEVTNGWVTGMLDDTVAYKQPSIDFGELISEQRPPVTVYWVFAPTSNVFSTAIDILVPAKSGPFEDPKAALLAWIEEQIGVSAEAFERAFG